MKQPRSRMIFGFVLWILSLYGYGTLAQNQTVTITILHSNDFHGYNFELLAKRATLIKRVRATNPSPVLLLDAGDVFTRGRYARRFYGELEFAVMNGLHYHALTLGNNEFKATGNSSALQVLQSRIKQAAFPVLCGNVVDPNTGELISGVRPYIIKDIAGIRCGILGVTARRSAGYRQLKGWKVLDPLVTAEGIAKELSGKVDLTIALTHIGVAEDRILAAALGMPAVIVGGDSHTILMEPLWVNGHPIVQAGDSGYFLGKLEITLEKTGQGWKLKDARSELLRLNDPQIEADPEVMQIIQEYLGKQLPQAA